MVIKAKGFWGWVDFWMTWDGRRHIRFAGELRSDSFALRRVHGLRFINYVSVKARGAIAACENGSRIDVSVSPTLEEFWNLLPVVPVALWVMWGSSTLGERFVAFLLVVGLPFGWFFRSRSREIAETEAQLRSLLEPGG